MIRKRTKIKKIKPNGKGRKKWKTDGNQIRKREINDKKWLKKEKERRETKAEKVESEKRKQGKL